MVRYIPIIAWSFDAFIESLRLVIAEKVDKSPIQDKILFELEGRSGGIGRRATFRA